MIPTRLELHNFGPIPDAMIDLDAVDLAAIVGHNGAGKSTAFTIAPLWALFGGTKNGCSPDDLVRMGELDASVGLEFDHRGELYRVRRTRSKNGRGKSSLELQKLVSGEWETMSGATIKETEEKIRALLGLDEETFTASSMILQGKANEFTAKAPGQRKAILSQILGLDVYDRLQEGAKEHARSITERLGRGEEKARELAGVYGEREEIAGDLAKVERGVQAGSVSAARLEIDLRGAEEKLVMLREAEAELARKKDELAKRRKDVDLFRSDLAILRKEKAGLEQAIDLKDRILERCASFDEAEKRLAEAAPLEGELKRTCDEINRLLGDLERERASLLRLDAQVDPLRKFVDDAPMFASAASRVEWLKKELERLNERREEDLALERKIREFEKDLGERVRDLERKRSLVETRLEFLRGQAAKIERSGCVAPEVVKLTPCAFLRDALQAARDIPGKEEELLDLRDPLIEQIESALSEARTTRGDFAELFKERSTALKLEITALEPKAAMLPLVDEKRARLESVKAGIVEYTERIATMEARFKELSKRRESLSSVVGKIDAIKKALADADTWRTRRDMIPVYEERLKHTDEKIDAMETDIRAKECDLAALEEELVFAPSDESESALEVVVGLRRELDTVRRSLDELHARRGGLKERLDRAEEAKRQLDALEEERLPLVSEKHYWSKLVEAFGRNGIPALVIENAVPELERIANEILGEMSQGRHSLRFETQRELKSRAGMAETLDIIVADWMGARPYETFSGGEQLRIDFAIRFALAELLARRAGSRIEWLVIDEGLGSQDKEHRELVLEAIRNVAGRFRKVLVITHVEEAQGAFPQQIRFERTDDGVEITVQ